MLIFKREPALFLTLIAVGIKTLAAFGLNVTGEQQAVINAVAAGAVGLLIAVMAHDGIGAAVLGFVQAIIALAVGFGADWSAEQQAIVLSLAAAVVGMFDRTQVTAPAPAAAVAKGPRGV
jgi:nicotinamide riboside transporter PnuC